MSDLVSLEWLHDIVYFFYLVDDNFYLKEQFERREIFESGEAEASNLKYKQISKNVYELHVYCIVFFKRHGVKQYLQIFLLFRIVVYIIVIF